MSITATYCPEDNKLRLYSGRVDRPTFERLRSAGYKSTPKQSCDFVATWSPAAEDIALELIDEGDDIGDEDYSPEERAADRAERFAGYRDNRREDANDYADQYDGGPAAHGYQSQARAERAASRHNRKRDHALTNWGKAEYWQRRTEGVIGHALYRSSPDVRRGRILRLESELRGVDRSIEEVTKRFNGWQRVLTLDGCDELLPEDSSEFKPAHKLAYVIAGDEGLTHCNHPDAETQARLKEKLSFYRGVSTFDLLTSDSYAGEPMRRLTPAEVAHLAIYGRTQAIPAGSRLARWQHHLTLRIEYERQMLAAEGGSAQDEEIVAGGFFGRWQVVRVHKSTATKKATSVTVVDSTAEVWKESRLDIKRLGEGHYRAPTDGELIAFKERQAKAKAAAPKTPPLINPTLEDAKRLQELLNEDKNRFDTTPREVEEMTQAVYSKNSGGSYSPCETVFINEQFRTYRNYHGTSLTRPMFKVRMYRGSVIVLTDKPQKPIPWDTCAEVAASWGTLEEAKAMVCDWAERRSQLSRKEQLTEEDAKTFDVLRYHGLAHQSSVTQWGLNDAGWKVYYAYQLAKGNYGKSSPAGYQMYQYGWLDREYNITPKGEEVAKSFAC